MTKIFKFLTPKSSAIIGFFLSLPLILIYSIIVFKIEPVNSYLAAYVESPGFPKIVGHFIAMGSVILLLPAFAFSVWPLFQKDKKGKRHVYLLNLILSLVIFVFIYLTWGEILEEIYRCNALHIPNCD